MIATIVPIITPIISAPKVIISVFSRPVISVLYLSATINVS